MKKQFLLAFVMLTFLAFGLNGITPSDVIKSPDKFDKMVVKVRGIVKKFKAKTSKTGSEYILFDLTSGVDRIAVYSHGKLDKPLNDGDKVEVEGTFTKLKTVGTAIFKNEIDCSGKKGAKPKITVLK